jgi:mono/diheme cytochrome c family protein
MRWGLLVAMFALVFAIAGLYLLSSRVDLSAIQQPGHTGEYLRTKLTRAVIRRRAAREEIPPPLPDRQTSMSIAAGKNLYDMDCASCHGSDEKGPTPVGRGMLPRTVALDSGTLQIYSDREMFSIIREGVRFTGMPGFLGTETNEQIWNVVDYLRSLP